MNDSSEWHAAVLIPARNEEKLLPRCLDSVLQAKVRAGRDVTVDIIVIADSSTDKTAQLATDILGPCGIACSITAGAVGTARRAAADVALRRARRAHNKCWIANTDADCIVPSAWLSSQLALARIGIEAIAGTVSVDTFEEHGPEVRERFKSSYRIESYGGHPHIHGANLGIRADAYLRAGGWRDIETAEDHDLWSRLARYGTRRLATSQIEVQTSGRRIGRAPDGFAASLAAHNERSVA